MKVRVYLAHSLLIDSVMSLDAGKIYPVVSTQPQLSQHNHQTQLPIITSQPATNTVIVNQAPVIIGKQAWKVGLCDCCHNMKHCLCTFFFSECYAACLASRMGENCCVGCCLGPAGLMAMRASIRAKHNLEGDICTDCCVTNCCYPCAVCQTANELDHQGYKD